ncbi:hypothetical protein Tco_0200513 [Tanacetum coccineum]
MFRKDGMQQRTPIPRQTCILDFVNGRPAKIITERGLEQKIGVLDEVAYEIPSTGNASTTGVALETDLPERRPLRSPPKMLLPRRRKTLTFFEESPGLEINFRPIYGQVDQRIQVREEEIKELDLEIKSLKAVETEVHDFVSRVKNLETLHEAEVDMKKVAEAKNVGLAKELESLRAQFADLQVSNNQLSEQVSTLQTQVTGEERIKAAFEEFKKYEDD